ncbi:D-alanyl-D-alanine carboxypeptidase family protein [Actinoallomurus rhizosphaericola]|uniref:D-alanyl-D-alanine carboxypeptidase family protein n=1 Tax=Actinoallomurus rhizosphaericola TaxID=2952536 RepID=UPI0020917FFE|nr:hypothetical protein [Actinoallomurus rhizosphaericola]MCO5994784.1 hypothetical protein [Actinoallomurus rhizosphaericola]
MNDASQESQDDARHETSGPPSPGDPESEPEPGEETGAPSDADADESDAPSRPAPEREDSPEPGPATEPTSDDASDDVAEPASDDVAEPASEDTADADAEPEHPSPATGHDADEDDVTDADAEDDEREDEERPEPSSDSAEPSSTRSPSSAEPSSIETVAAETVAAEAASGDDETVTAEHVRPESPAETGRPSSEPGDSRTGAEDTGAEESGVTRPSLFEPPPRPKRPAVSLDPTVMDLPRLSYPLRRRTDPRTEPAAPHAPAPRESRSPQPAPGPVPEPHTLAPREPRPPQAAPSPVPEPRTPGAPREPEADTPVPPRRAAASEHPPAPRTVEQALPGTRPFTPADFANTTQRDGLPMIAPPAPAMEPYRETPPRTAPPRTTPPYQEAPPRTPSSFEEAAPRTAPSYQDASPRTAFSYQEAPPRTAPSYQDASPRTAQPPAPMLPPATTRQPVAELAAPAPEADPPVRKRRRGRLIAAIVVLMLLAGGVAGQLVRPVPTPTLRLTLSTTRYTFGGPALDLPWPQQGQATLYAEGLGSMGSAGGQTPTPTASVAKVMTAYVVLHDHALRAGEDGPTFQISAEEAARLPERKQRGESLVEVVAGQEFTEHKALEALLIVSANNLAHELARWDAGDEQAFVEKMNTAARSLGMTSTTYTDPSGYDSHTVSTAADQVKLLAAAMKLPAFAEIVAMHTYVPNDGRPPRSAGDVLVGRHGVIGGKTGYTDAAGGNFVFAAQKRIGKVTTTIVGAVMGQQSPSAMGAIEVAQHLVVAAENALTSVTLAKAGARVAQVDDGLGGRVPLRAAQPVTVVGWSGLTVPVRVTGDPPHQAAEGERVGTVRAGSAAVPVTVDRDLDRPSLLKRLIRLR